MLPSSRPLRVHLCETVAVQQGGVLAGPLRVTLVSLAPTHPCTCPTRWPVCPCDASPCTLEGDAIPIWGGPQWIDRFRMHGLHVGGHPWVDRFRILIFVQQCIG